MAVKKTLLFFLVIFIFSYNLYAYENIDSSTTLNDRMAIINQQMKEIYNIHSFDNIYEIYARGNRINENALLSNDINNIQIYYGDPPTDTYFWNGKLQNRLLGYTVDGGPYDNQDYPWDNGWDGTQIQNMNFVDFPWKNPKTLNKGAQNNKFNGKLILEPSILKGLEIDFKGHTGKDHVPSNILNPAYRDRLVYEVNSTPREGGNWVDYVYIEQPPTYDTWGYGRLWIENAGGRLTYLSVRLAPFKMLITAECEIITDPIIQHNATSSPGTFTFDLHSEYDLTSYEIINIKNATLDGPATQNITGNNYSGSVLITIATPTDTTTVEMTIKCIDEQGFEKQATATATVRKDIPPVNYDTISSAASLTIQAAPRGAGTYDAVQGIPTNEKLYTEILADAYIAGYTANAYYGSRTYTVTFQGTLANGNPYTTTENVTRSYSYQNVDNFYVYAIQSATVQNYALPYGNITLTPKAGYTISASITEGGIISEPSDRTITLENISEDMDFATLAESYIGTITTQADTLHINGTTFAAGQALPQSTRINNTTLFQEDILIKSTLENKKATTSTATITYELTYDYNANEPTTRTINATGNTVTVHTPIACDGGFFNYNQFNQEITPANNRANIVLGRPAKLQLLTTGQHKNIPGYGNKDYEKFAAKKQVRFPFDVYFNTNKGDNSKFVKSGTWCDVPLNQDQVDLFIPTWVNEGDYTIEYRTLAINMPLTATTTEALVNTNMNYIATDTSPVHISGRLYGFKVTDISNYPLWEGVFRAASGSAAPTGTYYYPGLTNENGQTVSGRTTQFTLPLMEGSHPTVKNQALPTGYHFKFEMETIGDYAGTNAAISITPKFYYVSHDGTKRQKVDLYYHETFDGKQQNFVKIDNNTLNRKNPKYTTLGDPYRNVPGAVFKSTAQSLGVDENTLKTQSAKIGYLDWIVLPGKMRTFVGNTTSLPTGVSTTDALASVQHWYGEYYLPNDLYAVADGYNVAEYGRTHNGLDGKEAFWLKDGYIVVNFDITTHKDIAANQFTKPVLSYVNTSANMWQIEGFDTTKTDSNGVNHTLNYGDILFYYTDYRASDDYNTTGTH